MDTFLNEISRVVVTGMGFTLPGPDKTLCVNKDEFWDIISKGKCCIENDGLYYGLIHQTKDELKQMIPEIPDNYMRNYSKTHLYGLISLIEACNDAQLTLQKEIFANAAVLTARNSIDPCFQSFQNFLLADPDTITPLEAKQMFTELVFSSATTDVVNVQSAFLQSGGATFSLTCGCASSAVLIGVAKRMIENNEVDIAIVTGLDTVEEDRITHYDRLRIVAEQYENKASFSAPPTKLLLDKHMKPYDKNSRGFNGGIGSVTIILESEKHAKSRKAKIYGEIISQATARSQLSSAMTLDESGSALIKTINMCIDNKVDISNIGYVNGGAQGDEIFNIFESNAINSIFKENASELLVSSQEGCFGHNASALGAMGVAATLLMMNKNLVCPTAGCDEKAEICSFNPVPGKKTIPYNFDYALSFNYQAGGVCSSILLGRYRSY